MKDKNAQLLLVAIVILAVTLILIASSAAVLLSVKKDILREVTDTFATDFEDIKLKLGYAIEDELSNKREALNKTVDEDNNTAVMENINASISNVSSQFEYLEALKGRIFNVSYIDATFWANDSYKNISFNITIKLQSQDANIQETKKYRFEYVGNRYRVKIL